MMNSSVYLGQMVDTTGFIQNFSLEDLVIHTKSSKHRRQLINQEIDHIRSLLPMRNSSLQRLSQLEVMSMACIQIRKSHFLGTSLSSEDTEADGDLLAALPGFFLVCTIDGKLVYISNNVTDFLGHSMSDITKQGDNIYDIVDVQDHAVVRDVLNNWTNEEVNFRCRIALSRYTRRQSSFFDEKVKMVQASGYFIYPSVRSAFQGPVMVTLCLPVLSPAIKSSTLLRTSTTFTTLHNLDMKFIEATHLCEFYLGYTEAELVGKSWYEFISASTLQAAATKHSEVTEATESGGCCIFHGEMINRYSQSLPVAICLQAQSEEDTCYIVCTVQVLRTNSTHRNQQAYPSEIDANPGMLPETETLEEPTALTHSDGIASCSNTSPVSQSENGHNPHSIETILNPLAQYHSMMSSFLPHMYQSTIPDSTKFLHPLLGSFIDTEHSMMNYYEKQFLTPLGTSTASYEQQLSEGSSPAHYTDLTTKPSKTIVAANEEEDEINRTTRIKKTISASNHFDGGYNMNSSPDQIYNSTPSALHSYLPAMSQRNLFTIW